MDDTDPYDPNSYSQAEIVEMMMGNGVGEPKTSMKEAPIQLTSAQASIISRALSEFSGYETDSEIEVGQRTERLIREKYDLE